MKPFVENIDKHVGLFLWEFGDDC